MGENSFLICNIRQFLKCESICCILIQKPLIFPFSKKIVEIYNHYIENTVTTFEEKSLGNWTSQIETLKSLNYPQTYLKLTFIIQAYTCPISMLDSDEMNERISSVMIKYPWIVFEDQGNINGYAYATSFRSRQDKIICSIFQVLK